MSTLAGGPAPLRCQSLAPTESNSAATLRRLSGLLGGAVAVLHKDRGQWCFKAGVGGVGFSPDAQSLAGGRAESDGTMWTGLVMGDRGDWVLIVPGAKGQWEARADLGDVLDAASVELASMSRRETAAYLSRAGLRAYALGRRLARARRTPAAYEAIVKAMSTCVRARYGALAILVRSEGALRIAATYGYPQSIVEHLRVVPGEGVLGRVFESGKALLVGPEGSTDMLPRRPRYRTQSCIILPLTAATGVLGVVAIADPREGGHFDRLDMRALNLFVPAAVGALEREALREDATDASQTALVDYVTGLANRQYLQKRLPAEIQRAGRLGQPLAVLLIDVDNFKLVNDTCGHLEGDRVLRDLAAHLAENVRSFDVCTRYGGEEFAIVMPGAEQGTAIQIAERVRKAVERAYADGFTPAVPRVDPGSASAEGVSGPGVRITVSAGVALMVPGDTADTILRRADAALLRAKAEGKNAVRSG